MLDHKCTYLLLLLKNTVNEQGFAHTKNIVYLVQYLFMT